MTYKIPLAMYFCKIALDFEIKGDLMMDKGTFVRTFVLLMALINQLLTLYNKSPLPLDDEELEQFVSMVFTTVAAMIAWYKNNYITKKGHKQKQLLEEEKLTKVKKNKHKTCSSPK
ncbi:phage holin [Bacillus halotolerans]|uniref:phage holin n=2 Tax=Bacillaceae TaxID=186817 RepID=UPI00201B4875|nr:phage holin [Bacillus halotolerans]